MTTRVWIFGDIPLGRPAGPSYMVESWQRELTEQGFQIRTFTPSPSLHQQRRDDMVAFRSLRNIGFPEDYHARYSVLVELLRARRQRPEAIVVTTLGRVGLLGLILASAFSIPLVIVVSTNTTGMAVHYNTLRALTSAGVKPAWLFLVSRRIRRAFLRHSSPLRRNLRTLPTRFAAHAAAALHAGATELVMLSPRGSEAYRTASLGTPVTIFPAGIDRLPDKALPPELHWRPGSLRVLYVGRFAPEKNVVLLIQALRTATDNGLDVHLTLVGGGPLRDSYLQEGKRLGVADRLTVIGPYPRGDLGGIYASADVFAFPSLLDTQAFVLNEAAHAQVALLVSDTVNSVVEDEVSALVIPTDPDRYAEGFARLRDPLLRHRLGTAAKAKAEQVNEASQCRQLAEVVRRAANSPLGLDRSLMSQIARSHTVAEPDPATALGPDTLLLPPLAEDTR